MADEVKEWQVTSEDRGLEMTFYDVTGFMGRYVIRKVFLSQLATYATTLRFPDLKISGPNNAKKAAEYYAIVEFKPKDQAMIRGIYEIGYSGYRIVAISPKSLVESGDAIKILSLFDQGLEKGCDWQPTIWCIPDFNLGMK